jgi:hypothetical protein
VGKVIYLVRDISEHHAVSQHTVLEWIKRGELRAINVARRPGAKRQSWRITAEALAAFEAARTSTPPPPRGRKKKQPPDVIKFY